MFKMVAYEGTDGPVAFCDFCGERIHSASEGNYEWERVIGALSLPATMYLSHKRCSRALEQTHISRAEGVVWCTMELTCLPVYLGNALGLNWADARELSGSMASI